MSRVNIYLVANATWFLAFGIQMVVFAWLITIELRESPTRVGVAQMALLVPTLFLMLVGGSLADRYGGRLIACFGQVMAAIGPFGLSLFILSGNLTFAIIIGFALWMGTAQALVTPARDGLLAQLAEGAVQKLVLKVSIVQFGIQSVGFVIAAFADQFGAPTVLTIQSLILISGVIAFLVLKVDERPRTAREHHMVQQIVLSIREGFATVRATPALLTITLQNLSMGTFFMGSFVVTFPLLIRQNFEGTSAELAGMNFVNAIGIFLCTIFLLRTGGISRPGRALILSQVFGAACLGIAALVESFNTLLFVNFLWGISFGLCMPMARSIMQEQAPESQRARIMSVFSLSFMGAGLFGSVLNGYLVELYRAEGALLISTIGVLLANLLVKVLSDIWSLKSQWQAA